AEGSWHVVPHPKQPGLQNTYVNVLALQTLLDTRKAGLAWDGSTSRRDDLIRQTAGWLVRNFQRDTEPPGWFKDNGSRDQIIDGLTLQAYAVLFRASVEADVSIPEDLPEHARRHLLECGKRPLRSPDLPPYVSYAFRRHDGDEG